MTTEELHSWVVEQYACLALSNEVSLAIFEAVRAKYALDWMEGTESDLRVGTGWTVETDKGTLYGPFPTPLEAIEKAMEGEK